MRDEEDGSRGKFEFEGLQGASHPRADPLAEETAQLRSISEQGTNPNSVMLTRPGPTSNLRHST